MASQGIDGLGALANEQVSRAEHDGSGLRLLTLHGHEAHGGALSGLTDGLGIGHVVLLSLDERLHVRRRDQLHRVAELGNLTPPVVSAATGLHGHRAGRERCQEREELAAAQLLAKDNSSRAVGSVQLKDVLGEIQSDGAHLVHGRLLEWPATPPLWHTTAAGGVHTITAAARPGSCAARPPTPRPPRPKTRPSSCRAGAGSRRTRASSWPCASAPGCGGVGPGSA